MILTVALPVAAGASGVEVRYLGNEGFLLVAGESKVLIDALYGGGIRGYPAVPADIRSRAEAAEGEFAGVDLVLASHFHGDHFDAPAVARHLRANPDARFVSTRQAAERLRDQASELADRASGFWPEDGAREAVEHAGIRVTALRLHHGSVPAQNLGLIIELAGVKLIHLGDTAITAAELRPLALRKEAIDVALVPYWLIDRSSYQSTLDELGARHIVAMHLPVPDAPKRYFGAAVSLRGQVDLIREKLPGAWVPLEPLASRRFSGR